MAKYWRIFCVSFLLSGFLVGICRAEPTTSLEPFNYRKAYFYNFYSICPLRDGEVWIVGSHGMICAFHKESKQFVVQNSGTMNTLYSVSFVDAKKGWIAGQRGLILHTDDGGHTWVSQKSNTSEHLFSVCFKDSKTGWIAGAFGTILHTSDGGKTWSEQGERPDTIYNQVFFVDNENGWVVGEFGAILHTKDGGKTWEKQASPLGMKTLFSVFFKNTSEGWITGMDGDILETSDGGMTWTQSKSPIRENLFSIHVVRNQGWAVGLKGVYGILDNGLWSDTTSRMPTRAWLKQCFFLDQNSGWVVGSVGTILRTKDGGRTWTPPWNMATQ
jgi:photosystem II stability/assembly factor-like uncharacterized protein